MKVRIFDIQRGSFVDGPGIRTTVFLQGCNLRCAWCHNPESQSAHGRLLYFEKRCTHCGLCRTVCPVGAAMGQNGFDRSRCISCGACAEVCPKDARSYTVREEETDAIVRNVLRDRTYYAQSGGGVTFSGGESMLQIDALSEMLGALHHEGIHTAVDTAGDVPWTYFERILSDTSLFLYDLKAYSNELHQTLTGAGNARILENYRRLLTLGAHIWVRVPVVPGGNDVNGELEKVTDFINENLPEKAEFLPYHGMGEGKYEALGNAVRSFEAPSQERIQTLRMRLKI